MIGTSDGEQFKDWSDYHLNSQQNKAPILSPTDNSDLPVDHDHHVPLVASALMDSDGKMYGMAVDHRLNFGPEQIHLLALHEGTELPYMNDLVKAGMKPSEAYGVAHKVATEVETGRSIAMWGQEGHDAYKDVMRDAAAVASEPTDRPRHPDAHTTKYGLDESELNYKSPE